MFWPSEKGSTRTRNWGVGVLSVFMLSAVVLRLPNLTESIWYDELWSTRIKLGSVRELAFQAIYDIHPPAYSTMMYLWINVFGDSELSVRVPPLLFGIATIVLAYAFANYAAGSKVALLSAFLLVISPVHIWYSQEARQYSMLLFAVLLVVVSKIKLNITRPNQMWFGAYTGAVLLCVFGHYYLVAYVFLISIIIVTERHENRVKLLIINGAVVLAYCLFLGVKFSFARFKTGVSYARPFSLYELYQLFFSWFFLGGSWDRAAYFWYVLVIQLFGAALFLRGIFRLCEKRGDRKAFELVFYLFLLPVGLLALSFVGSQSYIERSVLSAFPFFLIVLSAGALSFRSRALKLAVVTLLVIVSVLTTIMYFTRQDEWTVYKPNPDWRSASKYLEDEVSESSRRPVILTVTPADELRYYGKHFKPKVLRGDLVPEMNSDDEVSVYRLNRTSTPLIYDAVVRENGYQFYLVRNLYWQGDFDEVYDAVSRDGRYSETSVRSFKGLEIHRFDISNPVVSMAQNAPSADSIKYANDHWR